MVDVVKASPKAIASSTLTFIPGETFKTISVSILDDSVYEGDETYSVVLSNPVNADILSSTGTGTIVEEDSDSDSVDDDIDNFNICYIDIELDVISLDKNGKPVNFQEAQKDAVLKSLYRKPLTIIQGPPGTGKTTVIAEIILQILKRDRQAKILITSQTNLAVDNAIERLSGKRIVRPLRIGNIDKFEDEGKVYSVDRINKWMNSESNSKEENDNGNNAIESWIKTIGENCSTDDLYNKAITKWKKKLDWQRLTNNKN